MGGFTSWLVGAALFAAVYDTGEQSLLFTALTAWGILGLLLIVGMRPATGGNPVAGRLFDLPLFGLLLIGGLSAFWWTVDRGSSHLGLIKLADFVLLVFLLPRVLPSPRHYRPLLFWVVVLAGGLALYGFLQWPLGLNRMDGRLHSVFLIPNSLAGFLAAVLPLTVALIVTAKSRLAHGGLLLLAVLQAAALVATGSRGGWLAAGVGVTLSLVLMGWQRVVTRSLLIGVLVLGVSVVAIDRRHPELIRPRAASLTHLLSAEPQRYLIWQGAAEMIRERPVTGWGIGAFGIAYVRFKSPVFDNVTQYYAHNDYLQLAAELGVPGLVCFVWLIGTAVWMAGQAWRTYRQKAEATDTAHDATLLAGVAGGASAILLHSVVDFDLYVPAILLVLALYLGYVRSYWCEVCRPHHAVGRAAVPVWALARPVTAVCVSLLLALSIGRLYLADRADRAGRALMAEGRYEESVGRFAEATVWNPEQAAYYESLGFAYEHMANQSRRLDLLQTAESAFRTAVRLGPSDYRYHWNLGRFYKNYSSFSSSFVSYDPWSAYQKAAELYPTKSAILQELATLGHHSQSLPVRSETSPRSA